LVDNFLTVGMYDYTILSLNLLLYSNFQDIPFNNYNLINLSKYNNLNLINKIEIKDYGFIKIDEFKFSEEDASSEEE